MRRVIALLFLASSIAIAAPTNMKVTAQVHEVRDDQVLVSVPVDPRQMKGLLRAGFIAVDSPKKIRHLSIFEGRAYYEYTVVGESARFKLEGIAPGSKVTLLIGRDRHDSPIVLGVHTS